MRFLLITDALNYVGGGFEPLGMLYILSAVRLAGHEVDIVESDYRKAVEILKTWKPEVCAYSLYTGYHKPLIELNKQLKKQYKFISIFGGPHPTFFPEMIEEEGVDAICRGEGEEAVAELLRSLENGYDHTKIRNFWFKQDREIIRNGMRPLQQDLDKITFPARDLFYRYPIVRANKVRVVVTARGCPYSCTYCYNYKIKELYQELPGAHLRHRSVDSVIEEIKEIKDHYPIDFVYFGTDNFTTRSGWVQEFAEKYGEKLKIPFLCATRPETARLEDFKALKKAGCVTVYMGIESGDESLRRELLNRRMKNVQIVKAADYIHQADLSLATFNMMLFPGETLKQAWSTVYLNQKCKTDYTWVAIFQPYPRTKLAEYAVEKDYFDGDFDNLPNSWYRVSKLTNPEKKKLERLQKLAPLTVEFPRITPLFKFLINVPLPKLFLILMKAHKAYAYKFKIMKIKLSFRETFKLILRYLFDYSS